MMITNSSLTDTRQILAVKSASPKLSSIDATLVLGHANWCPTTGPTNHLKIARQQCHQCRWSNQLVFY